MCYSEVGLEVPFKLMHPKPDAGKKLTVHFTVCLCGKLHIAIAVSKLKATKGPHGHKHDAVTVAQHTDCSEQTLFLWV